MLRSCAWVGVMMFAGGGLLLSGCADSKPKPGGVTTVSPPTAPKAGSVPAGPEATKPAAGDPVETKPPAEDSKAAPPAGAGSTTGGGTETPGDGQ